MRRLTENLAGASRDLEEGLCIYREIGNRSAETQALNEAGTLYRLRGDLDRARSCHQRALDLAREIGIAWDEAHALAGLGRCALAAQRTQRRQGNCGRRWRSSGGSARPKPPRSRPNCRPNPSLPI